MKTIALFILRIWSLFPLPILQMFGKLIGNIHYLVNSRSAQITSANLNICGQPSNIRLDSLKETGKTILETPAIWLGSKDRIDEWVVEIFGESLLRKAVQDKKGLLILLPHVGNWELFNVFYRRFGSMTALYQPPRSRILRKIISDLREYHDNEMVPTNKRGLRRLYEVLLKGGTVAVLPDQVPSSGHFIPFFGEFALTDELTIRLQRKTGANVLMLVFLRRSDGYFDVHIAEADTELYQGNVTNALGALNGMIESVVALQPAQYQWEYKRYRERPRGEKKIYRFNKPTSFH